MSRTILNTSKSRRLFLQQAGAAGLLTACSTGARPAVLNSSSSNGPSELEASSDLAPRVMPGAVDNRILVVVHLDGGNDGPSMIVPADDAAYYDQRPNLAVDSDEVIPLDDRLGLAPGLAPLAGRSLTTVEGVGPIGGDLSHFAMTRRWEQGDADGKNHLRTGFLGRLADALDDGSPLVGVATGGISPAMLSTHASTMSMTSPDQMWFLQDDWDAVAAYQRQLQMFGEGKASESLNQLYRLAQETRNVDDSEVDWESPMLSDGGELGRQLFMAAGFIEADVGIRIVQATLGGFDTHDNHQWQHADLMTKLGAAVGGFLDLADEKGFADRVLVATTSEFGRRVGENDGGLDHGSASTMLVAGPVEHQRLGEPTSLTELDADDNLQTTMGFDRYLASLAQEWLGVEAASVLPGNPEPIGLV